MYRKRHLRINWSEPQIPVIVDTNGVTIDVICYYQELERVYLQ